MEVPGNGAGTKMAAEDGARASIARVDRPRAALKRSPYGPDDEVISQTNVWGGNRWGDIPSVQHRGYYTQEQFFHPRGAQTGLPTINI